MEYGDIKSPRGNAIIYWTVRGNNKLFKNAEIIASNFVISPLQINEETLMVNFPPVIIENRQKLLDIARANNVDLIRGGEIFVPREIEDFNEFYTKQIEKFNGIIQEYIKAYRKESRQSQRPRNIPELINTASDIMYRVRKLVKNQASTEIVNDKIGKLREIHEQMNIQMNGFDLNRIIYYLDKQDPAADKLVELYRRKFYAVFLENYEQANKLKKQIIDLETDFSTRNRYYSRLER